MKKLAPVKRHSWLSLQVHYRVGRVVESRCTYMRLQSYCACYCARVGVARDQQRWGGASMVQRPLYGGVRVEEATVEHESQTTAPVVLTEKKATPINCLACLKQGHGKALGAFDDFAVELGTGKSTAARQRSMQTVVWQWR